MAKLDGYFERRYLQDREFRMSEKVRRALRRLAKETQQNESEVSMLLRKAGLNPDAAVLSSLLKYHKTLKKLAQE